MGQFSFNLVDEGWIPCRKEAVSGEITLLGLRDTLIRAHEFAELTDPSPLVTVAIHRLLLAVLHRNFGPKDADAWAVLWRLGLFDSQALNTYFTNWQHRFDLFDDKYPFYQTADLSYDECTTSIAKLAHELAAGHNPTLFDHTIDDNPPPTSPAQAARLAIATQALAVGGLLAYRKDEDPKTHKSADSAPLVKGAAVLVVGHNLFETLMLNLHRYDGTQDVPFSFDPARDAPAWERDAPTRPEDRVPQGYLDLLTWQSRRLRLKPERTQAGQIVVQHVALMKGNQFPDGFHRRDRETMLAFINNPKTTETQDPWPALTFSENRALWRDSTALFQTTEKKHRPKILSWIDELADMDVLDRSARLPLQVAGLCSDRAKVLFWRCEALPVPLSYLNDETLLASLQKAIEAAEDASSCLGKAVSRLAELASQLQGPQKADKDRVRQFTQALGGDRRFWSALERPFRRFLLELPGNMHHQLDCLNQWVGLVCRTAQQVFDQIVNGLDASPRILQAVYCQGGAQHTLNAGLKQIHDGRKEEADAAGS